MPYVPLERLVKDNQQSIFKIVLIAAARANELAQGAQPLVKSDSKKVSVIALEEIADGKIRYQETKGKGKKASA